VAVKKGPRFRKRDVKTRDTRVGREYAIETSTGRIIPNTDYSYTRLASYTASATRLGERCWDEVHKREYTLYTYDRMLVDPGLPPDIPYADPEDLFGATALGRAVGFKRKTRPRKPRYLNPKGFRRPVRSSRVWTTGGPFYKIRASNPWYIVQGVDRYASRTSGIQYIYEGGFVPTSFGSGQMASLDLQYDALESASTPGDASPYGAEGWNRSRPRIDSSGMAQAMYESKDGPDMLFTTADYFKRSWRELGGKPNGWGPREVVKRFLRRHSPVEAANQHLNNAFGWAPFLNDFASLLKTQRNYERLILQLMRDNGQWVKRRRSIRKTGSQEQLQFSNVPLVWPPMVSYLYDYDEHGRYGHTNTYVEQTDDIWFEGQFSYYLPQFDQKLYDSRPDLASLYAATQWARVNGLAFNPELLWKVTPWSWLADWFGNAGHIISNITAAGQDNLVAKYAYIMRKTTKRVVNDTTLYTVNGNVNLFWYQEIETKHRDVASPYGFNLTWDDMSPYQLSILAALGFTKFGK